MKKYFVISLLIGMAFLSACKKAEVTEKDRELLVRIKDLTEYGYSYPNAESLEKIEKTAYFDGALQIEYDFETPESELRNPLYLYQSVSIEPNNADAKISRGAEDTGVAVGLKIGGIEKEEVPNFYNYGDSSSFYILKKDGTKVGNIFSMREKNKTFLIFIVGVYFDDAEIWRELIEPKLKKLSAHTAK